MYLSKNEVKACNTCKAPIAFLKSSKGTSYAVSVRAERTTETVYAGGVAPVGERTVEKFYTEKNAFHNCAHQLAAVQTQNAEADKLAVCEPLQQAVAAARKQYGAGSPEHVAAREALNVALAKFA